jgi:zinc transport system permease protein
MIEIFQYDFMRKAFLVGILLAVIIPCIGMIVVFKRLSLMGDAMSHSSLAGVAIGLILGFNPVLGAMGACLLAAFSIEAIRKKIPRFSELSIAIVLSVGVGLAGVLSGFVKKAVDFNRFLFGSIVSISDFDLALVICISISVFLAFLLLYKELFYISFDEQAAALSGVPVRLVNTIFTILTALTVSIAAQTVGALIVSSLMVVPVATGMILARSYRQTAIWSVLCAVTAMLIGLSISYYAELKPGGTIVLTGVLLFLIALMAQKILSLLRARKMKGAAHES